MGGGAFAWILIIGAVVFFIWLGVMGMKKKQEYLESGAMIRRDKDFMEYAKIFSLKSIPFEMIEKEMKSEDFRRLMGDKGISLADGKIIFKSGTVVETFFTAQLVCTEHTEEKSVYRFDFLSWKTSYGSPKNPDGMNLLLTAVEKMFLKLDPNTQVSTVKNPTRRG